MGQVEPKLNSKTLESALTGVKDSTKQDQGCMQPSASITATFKLLVLTSEGEYHWALVAHTCNPGYLGR
jgi:hypothetical protein